MKKTIIDLGCGTGNTLMPFYKKYKVVGIDLDEKNIDICKKKMPKGNWTVGDISNFKLNQYPNIKKIICTEVLEHVNDWEITIDNLSNVLSGTKLYLTVPHTKSEKKLLLKRKEYWQEIGHKHFFNGKEIKKILEKNGWKKIKIKRTNAALYFELSYLFKKNAPCIRNTYYKNILPLPIILF